MPIKQTFQYRDPRSTLLLNNSNKGEYGKQRGSVLFGFESGFLVNSPDTLVISPGAIQTAEGVKIFINEESSVSIDPSGLVPSSRFPYPKTFVVVINHKYIASSNQIEPSFEVIEVQTVAEDQEPAYAVNEVNMLTGGSTDDPLVDADRFGATNGNNNVYNTQDANFDENTQARSVGTNHTPIAKVQVKEPVQDMHTGTLTDVVKVIRYKNMFSQVNDLLGVNIFEPLNKIDQSEVQPMSSMSQDYGQSTTGTPNQHPLFGGFNLDDYRMSNYLIDGESLIDSIKRLDYFMRLHANATGLQGISTYNDEKKTLAELAAIGATGSNQSSDYASNFILVDGTHANTDAVTTADTHHRAIVMFDRALSFIVKRLGLKYTAIDLTTDNVMRSTYLDSDGYTDNIWDITNPPVGDGVTLNMTFDEAVQKLHDDYTSRKGDVIPGTMHYSVTHTDRNTAPTAGDRMSANHLGVSVEDDSTKADHTRAGFLATDDGTNVTNQTLSGFIATDSANTSAQTPSLISVTDGTDTSTQSKTEISVTDGTEISTQNKGGLIVADGAAIDQRTTSFGPDQSIQSHPTVSQEGLIRKKEVDDAAAAQAAFEAANGGIVTKAGSATYADSAGNNVGDSFEFQWGGDSWFFPANKISDEGVCHSNCHSNCKCCNSKVCF